MADEQKVGAAVPAQFPTSIWDGTSKSRSRQDVHKVDSDDFDQITAEVAAVQTYVLPPAWSALTLSGGWTNGAQAPASVRLVGKRVFLRGVILPGTKTDATTIFTLAAAYRPTTKVTFPLICSGGDTNDTSAALAVNTDGTCKIYGVANATSLDLSSVAFFLDQ